jgi:hypothetical protein
MTLSPTQRQRAREEVHRNLSRYGLPAVESVDQIIDAIAGVVVPEGCSLCALGFQPFNAEGIMWHQVNGRSPFRCAPAHEAQSQQESG